MLVAAWKDVTGLHNGGVSVPTLRSLYSIPSEAGGLIRPLMSRVLISLPLRFWRGGGVLVPRCPGVIMAETVSPLVRARPCAEGL